MDTSHIRICTSLESLLMQMKQNSTFNHFEPKNVEGSVEISSSETRARHYQRGKRGARHKEQKGIKFSVHMSQ